MPTTTPVLPTANLNMIVIGALVPILGYTLNKIPSYAKLPEAVKTFVHVVLIAAATGVYQAFEQGTFGWNRETEGLIVTALIAAFYAHGYLWKPGGVNTAFGARADYRTREGVTLAENSRESGRPRPIEVVVVGPRNGEPADLTKFQQDTFAR